jgi:hypothetical protein
VPLIPRSVVLERQPKPADSAVSGCAGAAVVPRGRINIRAVFGLVAAQLPSEAAGRSSDTAIASGAFAAVQRIERATVRPAQQIRKIERVR